MLIERLSIDIEPEYRPSYATISINLRVLGQHGKEDLRCKQILHHEEFTSFWDLIWDNMKSKLDLAIAELKKKERQHEEFLEDPEGTLAKLLQPRKES